MKKLVIGIFIGFALAYCASAYADEIESFIGKSIQGEFPVNLNGETLERPAIVVDGTSYLPVRAFAESVGYTVYFDSDLGIKLVKREEEQPVPSQNEGTVQEPENSTTPPPVSVESKTKSLKSQISYKKNSIAATESAIRREPDAPGLETWKSELEKMKTELADLEAQLAALAAQQ